MDTVDANRALGFPDDCREYTSVHNILKDLGVKSIRLMVSKQATHCQPLETQNPEALQRYIVTAHRLGWPRPATCYRWSRVWFHWLNIRICAVAWDVLIDTITWSWSSFGKAHSPCPLAKIRRLFNSVTQRQMLSCHRKLQLQLNCRGCLHRLPWLCCRQIIRGR